MKIAMISPNRESEKAISGYSKTLTEKMREKSIDVDDFEYSAGDPLNLFRKLSKLSKYDVVHIQHEYNLLGNYGLPFFLLYPWINFYDVKVVTTMHTVLSQNEKFEGSTIKNFLRKALYFIQNRWIKLFSDRVITHADFFKKILVKEYGYDGDGVDVVPQGILEDIPKYPKTKTKKELGLKGPVHLFMGGLVPDHGHDIIVRQADKIGKTILIVANPGPVNDRNTRRTKKYLKEIKGIIKENNFGEFVRLDIDEGITDENPLWWKYFSAADIILLPYRGGIGSGIFAHAMAAEKPVVASNIRYFNEISKNYGCIKTVKRDSDYPKAIKEAMGKENYKELTKGCKKYFRENNLSEVAKKYKKIYYGL